MRKTYFEQLYRKGWLKSKESFWSEADRFTAGQRLCFSYERSHNLSVGVVDPTRLYVNGGKQYDAMIQNSVAREDFLRAFAVVPFSLRGVVEKLVLNNIAPTVTERKETAQMKKELCLALDCLISHYMREKIK